MARFGNPVTQYLDDSGNPLVNGKIYFYESGTTTPKTTYADSSLTIPNANPVILSGSGRIPNIFFNGTARAKLVANDETQIWDVDPIGGDSEDGAFSDWDALTTYNVPDIVLGSDQNFYISITNSNSNNDPTASPQDWTQVSLIRYWNINETYNEGQVVKGSDELLYASLINSNTGNDPSGGNVNWKPCSPDRLDGQYLDGGGVADAYTANAPSPRINPTARTDGMIIRFPAVATNTGACTLNAFGLGVDDIKLSDGTTDPDAGDIVANKDVTVIDRSTYFELVRTGSSKSIEFTSGGTYTPSPDVKSIEFIVTGAGGGGGGADGQGSGTAAIGAGGGAGYTNFSRVINPEASYAVTIGAGGSGGAAAAGNGGTGGTSSVVGSVLNIASPGGTGGGGATGSSGSSGGGTGGTGSTGGTGGDFGVQGGDGVTSRSAAGDAASLGNGGASFWGGGSRGSADSTGRSSSCPGAGGGGGGSLDETTDRAGGDGADGIVVITEFF